jgi:hypothetical protein
VASFSWIVSAGKRLCADWRNGETTEQADQLRLAGGIPG